MFPPAVTGNFCDNLVKLPEQTVLSDAIYVPPEGTVVLPGPREHELGFGGCKFISQGADGKLLVSKNWKA